MVASDRSSIDENSIWTVTPVDQHVGRRIRGKRLTLGLTENDLATALGVGRDTIEAYERGSVRVPSEHLIQVGKFLGVTISYFFPTTPRQKP
jgi:transcriptional regulator with XRE-family HTH domain